jgi:hypothetical protein
MGAISFAAPHRARDAEWYVTAGVWLHTLCGDLVDQRATRFLLRYPESPLSGGP